MNRPIELPAGWPSAAIPVLPPLRTRRDRQRWLAERRRYICASDVAAILGVPGAYRSAFALWWQKRLSWSTDEQTEEQEWGHRLEDAVARKFAEQHPELKVRKAPASLWQHPSYDWIACTPDRIATHGGYLRPVELKTDQNSRRWGDTPPEMCRVQLLMQCAVLQGPHGPYRGHIAALVGKHYREYDLQFAAGEVDETIDALRDFHDLLITGQPPDVDAHPTTTEALERVYAGYDPDEVVVVDAGLAQEYIALRLRVAGARSALRGVENRLRLAMGTAGRAITPSGRVLARRTVFKRAGYSVAPTEIDELRYVPVKGGDG